MIIGLGDGAEVVVRMDGERMVRFQEIVSEAGCVPLEKGSCYFKYQNEAGTWLSHRQSERSMVFQLYMDMSTEHLFFVDGRTDDFKRFDRIMRDLSAAAYQDTIQVEMTWETEGEEWMIRVDYAQGKRRITQEVFPEVRRA